MTAMATLNDNLEDSGAQGHRPGQWSRLLTHLQNFRKTESEADRRRKWQDRRLRFAARHYGGIRVPGDDVDYHEASLIPPLRKKSLIQYAKEVFQPVVIKDQVDSSTVILDAVLHRNESRREFGMGLAGDLLQREYTDEPLPALVRHQLDEMEGKHIIRNDLIYKCLIRIG